MSLEQQLADNTAALSTLAAAMNRFADEAGKANAAYNAMQAASVVETKVKVKKPVAGTKYFFREANDVVYRIEPTDPAQEPMSGSVEITADEFAAHQTRLAAKFANVGNGASTAATRVEPAATTTASPDAPSEVDQPTLMAAVTNLSQRADGREQMTKILATFGVPKFSLLPSQRRGEALALVNAAIAA